MIARPSHVKKSSQVTWPMKGMDRWVCGSMPPGITSLPAGAGRQQCSSGLGQYSRDRNPVTSTESHLVGRGVAQSGSGGEQAQSTPRLTCGIQLARSRRLGLSMGESYSLLGSSRWGL